MSPPWRTTPTIGRCAPRCPGKPDSPPGEASPSETTRGTALSRSAPERGWPGAPGPPSRPLEETRKAAGEFSAGNHSRRLRLQTGDELEDVAAALNQTAAHLERTIAQRNAEKIRLATLLENLSEGVIVVAEGRTVRMINHEAARILGIPIPPREGQPYAETIRNPDILRFIDAWKSGREIPPAGT